MSEEFHEFRYCCERFYNSINPVFADWEIMAIYFHVMCYEGHTKIKHNYCFASEYLKCWFSILASV